MTIEPLSKHRARIPSLAKWHHGQWTIYNPGETLADRVARLEAQAGNYDLPLTWVALEDDLLLGSASLVLSDMETKPELKPWLASLFVAPEHRCRGVGGKLVERIEQEARERGFKKLFLFTPDQDKFYRRLGWRILEKVEYHNDLVTLMVIDFEET